MDNEELKYDQLPRILADNDVLKKIMDYSPVKTNGYNTLCFALDFIDVPYTAICTPKDAAAVDFITKFFADQKHDDYDSCVLYFPRWGEGTKFTETISLALFDSKTGSVTAFGNVQLHKPVIQLNKYLQDHDMYKEYLSIENIKTSCLLVKQDDDSLIAKEIKGPERPDISCFYIASILFPPQYDYDRPYGETLEELKECAEAGSGYAMEYMAYKCIDDKPEQAFYWFKKLADNGYDTAMHTLGLMYTKGYGVERNLEEAAYWFEKADEYACDGANEALEVVENAINNLKAAENGDIEAMEEMIKFYEEIAWWLDEAGDEKDNIERKYWSNKVIALKNSKQ